jgi:hypothetical protein
MDRAHWLMTPPPASRAPPLVRRGEAKSVASSDKAGAAGDALNCSHPVVGAASTASADSFFLFLSPDLVVGLFRDNDATGNPFRRGGVPMTAASNPGRRR